MLLELKTIIKMSKTSILQEFAVDYPTKYNNPCETCVNNPQNNPYASGVCYCALSALLNPTF